MTTAAASAVGPGVDLAMCRPDHCRPGHVTAVAYMRNSHVTAVAYSRNSDAIAVADVRNGLLGAMSSRLGVCLS